jgi:hypothetical protein
MEPIPLNKLVGNLNFARECAKRLILKRIVTKYSYCGAAFGSSAGGVGLPSTSIAGRSSGLSKGSASLLSGGDGSGDGEGDGEGEGEGEGGSDLISRLTSVLGVLKRFGKAGVR